MKKVYDKIIPINAITDKGEETWYLDVANLSLSELIELKDELSGLKGNPYRLVDGIIRSELGYDYKELTSIKREEKSTKKLLKKRKNFYKKMKNQVR